MKVSSSFKVQNSRGLKCTNLLSILIRNLQCKLKIRYKTQYPANISKEGMSM
ncbi:unnamed protein product [Phytomonas sp. EM1]|nr:unnamed protein product [Phytomonas sp. EM1]|eukprot:CCW60806.1 unnamed protein product [Phytomonas sp. isolate EM1]